MRAKCSQGHGQKAKHSCDSKKCYGHLVTMSFPAKPRNLKFWYVCCLYFPRLLRISNCFFKSLRANSLLR
jgi:hypothetical protein